MVMSLDLSFTACRLGLSKPTDCGPWLFKSIEYDNMIWSYDAYISRVRRKHLIQVPLFKQGLASLMGWMNMLLDCFVT